MNRGFPKDKNNMNRDPRYNNNYYPNDDEMNSPQFNENIPNQHLDNDPSLEGRRKKFPNDNTNKPPNQKEIPNQGRTNDNLIPRNLKKNGEKTPYDNINPELNEEIKNIKNPEMNKNKGKNIPYDNLNQNPDENFDEMNPENIGTFKNYIPNNENDNIENPNEMSNGFKKPELNENIENNEDDKDNINMPFKPENYDNFAGTDTFNHPNTSSTNQPFNQTFNSNKNPNQNYPNDIKDPNQEYPTFKKDKKPNQNNKYPNYNDSYPNSYPEDSMKEKPRLNDNNNYPNNEIPNDYINTDSEPKNKELEDSKIKNKGRKFPNDNYYKEEPNNLNYPEGEEQFNMSDTFPKDKNIYPNNIKDKNKYPNKFYPPKEEYELNDSNPKFPNKNIKKEPNYNSEDYFIPKDNLINENKINPKNKNQYPQNIQNNKKPKQNEYKSPNDFFPKKQSHSLSKSPKSSERAEKRKLSPGINNYYNPDVFDSKINKKMNKRINTSNSREKTFSNTSYFPDGNCWACDLGCSVSTTGYSPMTFSPYKNNFRRRNVTPVKQGIKYEQYTRHKKSGRNNSYFN